MPDGLKLQETGDFHFITFSCFDRKRYLDSTAAKETFEFCLEKTRLAYGFVVAGYVVMPEPVHLILSEPPEENLSRILQAMKSSSSKRLPQKPFWARRYYDFNLYSSGKLTEKLGYMHRNPVTRGLVKEPEAWKWSSHCFYSTGLQGNHSDQCGNLLLFPHLPAKSAVRYGAPTWSIG